jgi:hypothetical protein
MTPESPSALESSPERAGTGDAPRSVAPETSGPTSPLAGPSSPPRQRCSATKATGSRCGAWAVQKSDVENPKGLCSGHLGLGLAKAPKSYGRLGADARRRSREKALLHAEGEEALAVLREALEDGRFTDPILEAQARQLLDRKTLSALEAKRATSVAKSAAETARAKAEKERALDERFVLREYGDLSTESWAKFEAFVAKNGEDRQRDAARRRQQARSVQAVAEREIPIESMPRRRRRKVYTWRRFSEGGPTYENVRGSYVVPVELLP